MFEEADEFCYGEIRLIFCRRFRWDFKIKVVHENLLAKLCFCWKNGLMPIYVALFDFVVFLEPLYLHKPLVIS